MLKFNVLHLLVACGALGSVATQWREARGRSLTSSRLFMAPLLAVAAAFLLLALAAPGSREPTLWVIGLAAGLTAGAARGVLLPLQVDHLWERLRLPRTRDGLWVASLLGALALAAFGAELIPADLPWGDMLEIAASTAAAACAGFLAGRAGSLWLRALRAPHSTWRGP
jgi:hypothetical protein